MGKKIFFLTSPHHKVMFVLSCLVLCFLCMVVEGLVETGPRPECSFLDPGKKMADGLLCRECKVIHLDLKNRKAKYFYKVRNL